MSRIKINVVLCLILALANINTLTNSFLAIDENKTSQSENNIFVADSSSSYHFVMVVPSIEDAFWQTVKKGAFKAAKELNCGVEFNGSENNKNESATYLEIAIASKVDGIANCIPDDTVIKENIPIPTLSKTMPFTMSSGISKMQTLINKAHSKNIPVVTVDCDSSGDGIYSYVGTNRYVLGSQWGKLILASSRKTGNIAIMLGGQAGNGNSKDTNSSIVGLMDVLKVNPQMKIVDMQSSKDSEKSGIIAAESLTRQILQKNPKVDIIICSGAKETVGVAQTLVDLNRVGEVLVIGYDNSPAITKYIKKGVVFGTVVSDPYQMGYESIKALYEKKSTGRVSSYISTESKAVSRDNLAAYLAEMNKAGE